MNLRGFLNLLDKRKKDNIKGSEEAFRLKESEHIMIFLMKIANNGIKIKGTNQKEKQDGE